MITARNYAAQAERGIRQIAKNTVGKFETSYRNANMIAETIKLAQHFAIPDGGVLFDDKLKGLDLSNIRLPFHNITIEWFVDNPLGDGKHQCPKRVLVASEQEELGVIHCVGVWQTSDLMWGFNPFKISLKMDNNQPFNPFFRGNTIPFIFEDGRVIEIVHSFTQDKFADSVSNGNISPKEALAALQDSTQEVIGLFEFLEALSCRNVLHEPMEKIDHAKNARRIRDGKIPIYETKILTIDTKYGSDQKHNRGIGSGGGASVRQHLRRGHIRRHPSAGNIWVNSCVVGHSELGVIEKQYQVK